MLGRYRGLPHSNSNYNWHRTAIDRGINLLRQLGDRASVFVPGVANADGSHWIHGASLGPTAGMLGPDGVTRPALAWFQTYLDSIASTATAVDSPVGFLSDGEGVLGPELAPALNVTNWNISGGWAISNGVASHSGGAGELAIKGTALTNQATYRVSFYIANATTINVVLGGVYQSVNAVAGFNTMTGPAGASGTFALQGGGPYSGVTGISVKQLTGRHATQATGANKPTLRRGVQNLLTYSRNLSNAVWGHQAAPTISVGTQNGPDGSVSASSWARTTTAPSYSTQSYVKPAQALPLTQAFICKAGSGSFCALRLQGSYPSRLDGVYNLSTGQVVGALASGSFASAAASIAPLGGGFYLVALSGVTDNNSSAQFIFSFTSTPIQIDGIDSAANSSGVCLDAGLFSGIFTAQQIAALGGIPLTTTVPASSAAGNYGLEFRSGAQQHLVAAPIIDPNADHFIVVGGRVDSGAQSHTFFSQSDGGASAQLPSVSIDANLRPNYYISGGGVTTNVFASNVYASVGASFVLDASVVSRNAEVCFNGVSIATATLSGTYTTPTNSSIGSLGVSPRVQFVNGQAFAVVVVKSALSAAERQVLRRFVAALTGPIPGQLNF
jgi:hypothetical protein